MGNDMSMIEPYYDETKDDYNLGYPKYGDCIRWKGVLKVEYDKKKDKDAVVIVTNQRIYFFKPQKYNVPKYHSHLFDIKSIEIPSNSRIILTFQVGKKVKHVEFYEQAAIEMVRAIRTSIRDTTNNYGEDKIISITDFGNITKPTKDFNLSPSAAMVESYLSICSRENEEPSINHVYFLKRMEHKNSYCFDFSEIPGVCNSKSPIAFNLSNAFTALSYNTSFTQIKLHDVSAPGLDKAIALLLQRNEYIQVLEVVNCSTKLDAKEFCEELANSPVEIINFHGTPIMKGESLGVMMSKREYKVIKLDVNGCGINKLGDMMRGMMLNENIIKNIKALDISNNGKSEDCILELPLFIEKLSAIQSQIEYLNISNLDVNLEEVMNKMKGLNLKYLNITGNKWNKLDQAMELINFFQTNTTLKQICMSEMKFQIDHIVPVLSPIANNINLTSISLDLKNNGFGVDGGIELYKILPSFKNVKKLDLSGNKLKGKAMNRILTFMETFNELDTLYIGNNPMSGKELEEFIKNLITFIRGHSNVKVLRINEIAEKENTCMDNFLFEIVHNESLLAIDISGNHLNDLSTIPMGEIFMNNKTLVALDFDRNDFTIEGFLSLSYSIENNSTLSFVDYPSKMYKKISKQTMSVDLLQQFEECFYNFFNKIKTNKTNNCFGDIHIFDIINSYPLKITPCELLDKNVQPKLIGKYIEPTQTDCPEMPEQLKSFSDLKKDPNYYYN
ncbi:leucine-rich repeat containing protein [Entamoeba histolytica HM-1:IMSS-B]|nr:carmil, putative [Entamoeba histolytica KU27]EMH76517.1 leucine-rich repeat containing protein [Entamoeba histolytica HM-1:IMSS-B]ENY61947.1 carmil, putative [Entamoeba histolytica HM-1:IMSS-A]GAT95189.1 leucine-rich repeat containing protein [Entamoeba histolytica]